MCEAAELLWPGSVGVKHWAGSMGRSGQAEGLSEYAERKPARYTEWKY